MSVKDFINKVEKSISINHIKDLGYGDFPSSVPYKAMLIDMFNKSLIKVNEKKGNKDFNLKEYM